MFVSVCVAVAVLVAVAVDVAVCAAVLPTPATTARDSVVRRWLVAPIAATSALPIGRVAGTGSVAVKVPAALVLTEIPVATCSKASETVSRGPKPLPLRCTTPPGCTAVTSARSCGAGAITFSGSTSSALLSRP